MRETVEKACDIARYTAEDDCSGLADPEELARDIPDLDLDHPWDLPPEEAVETARDCEAAGRAVDTRITNSEGASVSSHRGVRVYGNSHGFLAGFPSTSHSVSCVLLAQAGDDMQRDYWYASARDARDLESSESIGRKAGERAVARLGARKIATQKARVLFAPEVARGLIGHFLGAIRGSSQYRKSSFLLGAAGQQVFPSFLELRERPHILQGARQQPVRWRRRGDARSRAGARRRAAGLRARQLFRAQARAQDHRQCRRHAQPARGIEYRRRRDRRAHARARHRACWSPSSWGRA